MRCFTLLAALCFVPIAIAQEAPKDVAAAMQILKKNDTWNLTGGLAYGPSQQLLATRFLAKDKQAERHFLDLLKTGSDVGKLYGALGLRFIESKKLNDPSVTASIKGTEVNALHGCIMGKEKDTDILQHIKSGDFDRLETEPKPRNSGKN